MKHNYGFHFFTQNSFFLLSHISHPFFRKKFLSFLQFVDIQSELLHFLLPVVIPAQID